MTRVEMIALATRIAQDFERAGLPPALMVADCYDEAPDMVECIHVFDSATLRHVGCVQSEAGYEAFINAAGVVMAGMSLN